MKIRCLIFFAFLCFSAVSQNKDFCEKKDVELLKEFYLDYMKGSSKTTDYIDKKLNEKINRMNLMIGADPIIFAQDVIPEMINTLVVLHIKNQWYKVLYKTTFNEKEEWTTIFVKIQNSKIVSIYPWLIDFDFIEKNFKPSEISNENEISFVETFYQNYLNCYTDYSENIYEQLKKLQNRYCSSKLLRKIEQIKREYSQDGEEGFDPLIANFDFDKSFMKSLKISRMDDNRVLLEYMSAFENKIRLCIHTKKTEKSFLIDDISFLE